MDGSFDSNGGSPKNFQPDVQESVALFISLACISLMSTLFGRKTAATTFASLNYARFLVIALYISSWLFTIVASMLAQTNNNNKVSCTISIFACILLYASSKVLIYLFLIERVHVVSTIGTTRWNSTMFRINIALLSPYGIVFILAVLYRSAYLESHDTDTLGQCNIGLKLEASIPFIVYDLMMSSWLTFLFLKSLTSSTSKLQGPTKSKLRNVARRTFVGSVWALLLSTANISILVYFQGNERGVLCLTGCTLDVTLNAVAIHWVTSRGSNAKPTQRLNSSEYDRHSRVTPPFVMDKQVTPLESHISVSIESYVEEYHQMHIAPKPPNGTNGPNYYNLDG
ncbi:hypothetical protein BGZ76_009666 [Entomortierella beljakovae]|nr:hypothetical protein BGZ76_009666 [Entomortierella beljakovae]